jgi:hypothetical protein
VVHLRHQLRFKTRLRNVVLYILCPIKKLNVWHIISSINSIITWILPVNNWKKND